MPISHIENDLAAKTICPYCSDQIYLNRPFPTNPKSHNKLIVLKTCEVEGCALHNSLEHCRNDFPIKDESKSHVCKYASCPFAHNLQHYHVIMKKVCSKFPQGGDHCKWHDLHKKDEGQ